jgi:hypothetical protein
LAEQVARLSADRGVTRLGALTLAAESATGAGSRVRASSWGSAGWCPARTPAASGPLVGTSQGRQHPPGRPADQRRPGPTSTGQVSAPRSPAASRAWTRSGRHRPPARRLLVGRADHMRLLDVRAPSCGSPTCGPTRVQHCGGLPIHHARRVVPTRPHGRHQPRSAATSTPVFMVRWFEVGLALVVAGASPLPTPTGHQQWPNHDVPLGWVRVMGRRPGRR